MPPLKPLQFIPVPPPTLPSATRPPVAASRAWSAWTRVTCCPFMSLSVPSLVSATTGYQNGPVASRLTIHSTAASRTTPTLKVLVMSTGVSSTPDSSTQCVPVMSPLPFPMANAANAPWRPFLPRGWIAVTPVRIGPLPTLRAPSPEISVTVPTSTPATSVMALLAPGVPSNGTPRSRARGLDCAAESAASPQAAVTRSERTMRCATWCLLRTGRLAGSTGVGKRPLTSRTARSLRDSLTTRLMPTAPAQ